MSLSMFLLSRRFGAAIRILMTTEWADAGVRPSTSRALPDLDETSSVTTDSETLSAAFNFYQTYFAADLAVHGFFFVVQ